MAENVWLSFLSENRIAIVAIIGVLLLLLVVFFATGRHKPRQPLGQLGGDSSAEALASAHDIDTALARIGGSVVQGRRGDAGGEPGSSGNPIVTAIAVLAVVALIAAGIIVFAISQ